MNQKPYRILFLWFIWSAISITVYAMLSHDTDVLSFIKQDQSHITWLILILFVIGVSSSLLLSVVLTLEALAYERVVSQVKDVGLKNYREGSMRWATYRFYNALKAVVTHHGQPDVESLLSIEVSKYHRASHSVEVIGNLLVTLGLIGTVMGLTLTLTGLTGSLEALGHDQALLLSGLRTAMGGMGTAFYTTLLGAVLGGVLLRVYAQITEHGTEDLYDKLMRTCLVHCAVDMKPSMSRDIRFLNEEIESLASHVKSLQGALDDSKQAMGSFHTALNDIKAATEEENTSLRNNIGLHQLQAETLMYEYQRMKRLNGWQRLKRFFGGDKRRDSD